VLRAAQVLFAGMMQYDGELHLPTHFLVPPPDIERTSGQYLVHNNIATFACSEARSGKTITPYQDPNADSCTSPNRSTATFACTEARSALQQSPTIPCSRRGLSASARTDLPIGTSRCPAYLVARVQL